MTWNGLMDDGGFAQWYRTERPRLYATLTAICGDREVAAAAADEALARACERWGCRERPGYPGEERDCRTPGAFGD